MAEVIEKHNEKGENQEKGEKHEKKAGSGPATTTRARSSKKNQQETASIEAGDGQREHQAAAPASATDLVADAASDAVANADLDAELDPDTDADKEAQGVQTRLAPSSALLSESTRGLGFSNFSTTNSNSRYPMGMDRFGPGPVDQGQSAMMMAFMQLMSEDRRSAGDREERRHAREAELEEKRLAAKVEKEAKRLESEAAEKRAAREQEAKRLQSEAEWKKAKFLQRLNERGLVSSRSLVGSRSVSLQRLR